MELELPKFIDAELVEIGPKLPFTMNTCLEWTIWHRHPIIEPESSTWPIPICTWPIPPILWRP